MRKEDKRERERESMFTGGKFRFTVLEDLLSFLSRELVHDSFDGIGSRLRTEVVDDRCGRKV